MRDPGSRYDLVWNFLNFFVFVFVFVFVIIVTACGRYIVDRFNRYRGNKTTEGSEKEK